MKYQYVVKGTENGEQADVYEEKRRFVDGELSKMLSAATRGVVERCEYERVGEVETVHIFECVQPFAVDVTADSPWAIAKDVIRAVAMRLD